MPTEEATIDFLSHFDKVKAVGQNKWIALCPAHGDKSPSLSIRLADDKILLHCFAGCTAEEVTKAAGLSIKDLFLNSYQGKKKKNKKAEIERAIEELHYTLLRQLATILRATDNILFYLTPDNFNQSPFAELLDRKEYLNYLFFELFKKDYDLELLLETKEEIEKWKTLTNN